jgi:RNA polymerase sigma factor (sigma-70 family)
MAIRKTSAGLKHLQTLFNLGTIGTLTDGQLLERFATGCGEARELAFAALVERHGAFVLRVCRGVLGDENDAHDAFQATFLALARKAQSLWVRDALGPWLHQAAFRAACHDRSSQMRRRAHERAAAALRPERLEAVDDGGGLERVIHEEINRLPDRFRGVVVLCDLEGRTHAQAARHLGCAIGTIKSRLTRAREKLRGRLVRRGVTRGAGALLPGAARSVPVHLAETTVSYAAGRAALAGSVPAAVVALTEGVLTSMFLSKMKTTILITALAVALTAGAVALAQQERKPAEATPIERKVGLESGWTYEILASKDGKELRKVASVHLTTAETVHVNAPGAVITFRARPEGAADPKAAEISDAARLLELARIRQGSSDQPVAEALDAAWLQEWYRALATNRIDIPSRDDRSGRRGSLEERLAAIAKEYESADADTRLSLRKAVDRALADRSVKTPSRGEELANRANDALLDAVVSADRASVQPKQPEPKPDARPGASASSYSNSRLDQLERKVDLILESLKALRGNPSGRR